MESGNRNDARVRGNAQQLLEKYKSLARDATTAGDRILAEYYMQHADHYYRVLAEFRSRYEDSRPRDRDERDQEEAHYEDDSSAEVSVPQTYAGAAAQQSLNLEASAPEATPAEDSAEEKPAPEAAEAPVEEEKPRRRRGRPRKVKAEDENAETSKAAENAA